MAIDQFCLKWNNFQSSIVSAFESLQSTEDLADVTLTTEGINVKAHKIILSACSPYFRTVFKENPCSHPIVILKDVLYDNLLAILNFMYHGEVLVAKDKLESFLQTAEMLQVSGLIGCSESSVKSTSKPKIESSQSAPKRAKMIPKSKKTDLTCKTPDVATTPTQGKIIWIQDNSTIDDFEVVCVDNIKTEIDDEQIPPDINENVRSSESIVDKPLSILETVLEVKDSPTSILERSLMSCPPAGKSPTINYPMEHLNIAQSSSELAKHLTIPRKSPEPIECDKWANKSKTQDKTIIASDVSESYQKMKSEESSSEIPVDFPSTTPELSGINIRNVQEVQPHHSSQCGNCPHCGKIYSNQSALKYHVRLVHSDLLNLYCCHLCPESFDYREGYKKHMVEVHSLRN